MRMTDSITLSDHYIKSPIYIFYDQIDKLSHFAAISSTLLFIIPHIDRPFDSPLYWPISVRSHIYINKLCISSI